MNNQKISGRGGARKRASIEETMNIEEYTLKRRKNNEAVGKTRQKRRKEESETAQRVDALRTENEQLERKVEALQKELTFLKEMFTAYANGDKHNKLSSMPTTSGINMKSTRSNKK